MFINASAEFCDPKSPVRRVAAEHKAEVVRYIRGLCEEAGYSDAEGLAEQINLLLEGAIVTAQVTGQVGHDGVTPGDAARKAKMTAERLMEG